MIGLVVLVQVAAEEQFPASKELEDFGLDHDVQVVGGKNLLPKWAVIVFKSCLPIHVNRRKRLENLEYRVGRKYFGKRRGRFLPDFYPSLFIISLPRVCCWALIFILRSWNGIIKRISIWR